jgi:primosomal protein N' (replication factor Y) (superfamily II helicase)
MSDTNKAGLSDDDKPFVDVAVALPVFKTLSYEVPPPMRAIADPGKRVLVPVRNSRVTGYILDRTVEPGHEQVKAVLDVLDEIPLFPASMVPFFRWIADYYFHPIGEVIKGALPGGLTTKQEHTASITHKGRSALSKQASLDALDRMVLAILEKHDGPLTITALSKEMAKEVPPACLAGLEKLDLIERTRRCKGGQVRPKTERFIMPGDESPPSTGLSKARRTILETVERHGRISIKNLQTLIPSANRLAKKMADDGFLKVVEQNVYRDPFGEPIEPDAHTPTLTAEQASVVATLTGAFGKGFRTFLLHGITGSGKTEVYMQAVEAALAKGRQAIVLVPEIALITQTERLFRARFGDCVALLHSRLSQGERFDQWMRIVRQEATIAIGARSALFAPFNRLGFIVVDEEHDDSYKQESHLRYHARDLAIVRAKLQGAVALLGSATPSVQSYHNVRTKKFHGLHLRKRIDDHPLPDVHIVDLRETRGYRRAKPFITDELKGAMQETLDRGEQVLLFLNRRGFANYPTCSQCGQPIRCINCDVTMTLHQSANAFKCHYCGYSCARTTGCPNCGNPKMKLIGLGTERVAAKVEKMFPEARIARMDRDTTTRKGALTTILKKLRENQIDILVGTQMVAKGHHYPNITLVGIVCADLSLNFPDFRAGERTFQLLAQVAGRAGRGANPGRVILQTFNPDHFCVLAAREQDCRTFYRHEIGFRQDLAYPPFSRLIQILITGKDKDRTAQYAQTLGKLCRQTQSESKQFQKDVRILGPVAAPLARIKKQYRWQILLKGGNARSLHGLTRTLSAKMEGKTPRRDVRVVFDIDPVNML